MYVATRVRPRSSLTWRSVADGFDSINLDPSPDLRGRASRYQGRSMRPAFVTMWVEVGQALRSAIEQVMTARHERS